MIWTAGIEYMYHYQYQIGQSQLAKHTKTSQIKFALIQKAKALLLSLSLN